MIVTNGIWKRVLVKRWKGCQGDLRFKASSQLEISPNSYQVYHKLSDIGERSVNKPWSWLPTLLAVRHLGRPWCWWPWWWRWSWGWWSWWWRGDGEHWGNTPPTSVTLSVWSSMYTEYLSNRDYDVILKSLSKVTRELWKLKDQKLIW